MTLNTPIPAQAASDQQKSKLRAYVTKAVRWWRDRRSGGRRDEPAMALQPFSFWPGQISALFGDGDDKPNIVSGYAFHTDYVPSAGGRLTYTVRLGGLTGTRGSLILSINMLDENGESLPPKTRSIAIDKLLAAEGVVEFSKLGTPGHSYALLGTLSDDSDARAQGIEISLTGGDSPDALRERFEAARKEFLSAPGQGELRKIVVKRQATLEDPISQMCTAAQMVEPTYKRWCERMDDVPIRHRKQWEFVFILRALEYYGALRPGAKGLGFGVGIEPLSSIFAAAACSVVATDLAADDDRARAWSDTDQLGANLRQIHNPRLCDEAAFFERVTYRAVDMNAIPADLVDFDFTWSSCAYEHLGSIEAGLAFFENSIKCLKPGGLAVHTTELNLSSNNNTLEKGGTVIFRRRDFEDLALRLMEAGHEVFPITFDSGDSELDRVIDLPPYASDLHLKLQLMRWVATSFGMIVRKKV